MEFVQMGDVYEGIWKNGRATGKGVFMQNKSQTVYKGEFYDCLLHGFG